MSIAENIARVRANIASAAKEAGRDPSEITLVGASKMNDADACRQAIAAGIDALGENREQEMTKKLAENAYDGAPLHFIGHLQRNKVKNVVGKVAVIEGVRALTGAPVCACDLRAGAALVIAGLAAQGKTELSHIQYIERGYEDLVGKLRAVGADISLVEAPDESDVETHAV